MPIILKNILLVGLGGFTGSVFRYLAGIGVVALNWTGGFPLATFLVNAIGSFIIGILLGVQSLNGGPYLFGIVGFCGGFTTFSAFSSEALNLIREGSYGYFTLYLTGSIIVCIGAVCLGMAVGARIR